MMADIPVCLFLYKRYEVLDEQLDMLWKNDEIDNVVLFIFCDGPKKESDLNAVENVRSIINRRMHDCPCKEVHVECSEVNKGLSDSVISGVNKVLNIYDSVIVIEDDLALDFDFLSYMKTQLYLYKDDKKIFSVGGYYNNKIVVNDCEENTFFSPYFECWGWGIWKDRWNSIVWDKQYYINISKNFRDMFRIYFKARDNYLIFKLYLRGEVDSWAIRVAITELLDGCYTVIPLKSKVENHGNDGNGTNCGAVDKNINKKVKVKGCKYSKLSKNIIRYHKHSGNKMISDRLLFCFLHSRLFRR